MNGLSSLFEGYQGKHIFIETKSKRKYKTSNFQIINSDYAVFNDLYGLRVTIRLDEILRIEEIRS
jgi:hypothetical protein